MRSIENLDNSRVSEIASSFYLGVVMEMDKKISSCQISPRTTQLCIVSSSLSAACRFSWPV